MTDLLSSRSEHRSAYVTTMRSPAIPNTRKANPLRAQEKSPRPNRRVTFCPQKEILPVVLTRSEIPQEEFEAVWYCHHEFRAMKKTMVPIIKKMAKGMPLEENEEPRGLEHKTPQGSRKRCDNRFVSMDAVLQEQDRQWEYDRIDPSALAKVYNQASAHCLMQAYLKAKEDAEFVEKEVRGQDVPREEKENDCLAGIGPEKAEAVSPRPMQPRAAIPTLQSPRVLSAAA